MTKKSLGRNIIILFAIAAYGTISSSQAPRKIRLTFKTASIKHSLSGYNPGPPAQTDECFAWNGRTLKELLSYAYRIRLWQIKGGPDWLDSQRWDLEAKAEEKSVTTAPKPRDPFTPDGIALMLQSLLEDRFKLRIQRQLKEALVYNLVVDKGGPKIKLDADQSPPAHVDLASLRGDNEMPRGIASMGPSSIKARAISITDFINRCLLSRTDRSIIDRTNLKGLYNFKMQWSPEDSVPEGSTSLPSPFAKVNPDFGPAFFMAMREQLGLQLESAKGPVNFIVIASVEKPSEN